MSVIFPNNSTGLKLSNDVKNKARIIENLRFKNNELLSYKKGYEKGIKNIKRDMLVLKFINKTKTKLLRKYTRRLQDNGKFVDCTDLRKPLSAYLIKNQVRVNTIHTENLYIKNQLKSLANSKEQITTGKLVDFFLRMVEQRDIQNKGEIKKYREKARIYKAKHSSLSKNMQNYRNTMAHLPKLLYNIVVESMYQNDLNQYNSEGEISYSTQGKSLENESNLMPTLDINEIKVEDKSKLESKGSPDRVSNRDPAVKTDDENTQKILEFPTKNKKLVIENLMKNNVFMAAVAEVIAKNDLYNYKRSGSQRSYRSQKSTALGSVKNSMMYNKSRIVHQKYLASLTYKDRTERLNFGSKMITNDSVERFQMLPLKKIERKSIMKTHDERSTGGLERGIDNVSVDMESGDQNIVRRQKILRYLLRSKHGRKIGRGKFMKGSNFGKRNNALNYSAQR